MPTPAKVVLRRTWPQRFVMVMSVGVIVAALAAAWFIEGFYVSVASIGRVEISGEILISDTAPGEPVNFLLIGNDSALGTDPIDPINIGREYDPRGFFNADSITILRVDPRSGQAWVLSVPRDLMVDIPRASRNRINAALLIGGPGLLVETVTEEFGIEINHYVELDFFGFRQVVDQLRGVPVWFDYPARDSGSGLNIPSSGCHLLDGEASLQYVRARGYQEFIDDEWVTVGNSDFGRIERQQDFLVLALDRAIARGARSPTGLAALIEAAAVSVVLDPFLTPSELIEVGEAFSEFNPENLDRFSLQVSTVTDDNGRYQGEELVADVNEAIFDIFRGVADLVQPSDVRFDLYALDHTVLEGEGQVLLSLGFDIAELRVVDSDFEPSVVVYGPGKKAEAETIARYLIPIPALVLDSQATRTTVYLGAGHEQISWLSPHDVATTRRAIEAHGEIEIPDLSSTVPPSSTATSITSTTTTTTTTTMAPDDSDDATVEAQRIIGRPPDGQSCG